MRGSVTRAAEGFDRRAFTVDEVLRMQEAGIISEDENFELIEGEIVPMQAKTPSRLTPLTRSLALRRLGPEVASLRAPQGARVLGGRCGATTNLRSQRPEERRLAHALIERGPGGDARVLGAARFRAAPGRSLNGDC